MSKTAQLDPRDLTGLAGTLLGDLGEKARLAILEDASLVDVPRGQHIFDDDLERQRLGFLLSGTARVYLTGPDGRTVTVEHVRPGSMVTTLTPGVGQAVPTRTEAVTDCSVIELRTATVRRLVLSDPSAGLAISAEQARRLDDVYREFAAFSFGTFSERLAHILLERATETPRGLSAPVTQPQLAAWLGTAREVVSRTLRAMREQGLVVTRKGSIDVVDAGRLAAAAGPWFMTARLFAVDPRLGRRSQFDDSVHPVVGYDSSLAIVYASPKVEEAFGWLPADLVGKRIVRLLPQAASAQFTSAIASMLARAQPGPLQLGSIVEGRRKDRSPFPAEIMVTPVQRPSGPPIVFATIVDVTYRRALREYLMARGPVPADEETAA